MKIKKEYQDILTKSECFAAKIFWRELRQENYVFVYFCENLDRFVVAYKIYHSQKILQLCCI